MQIFSIFQEFYANIFWDIFVKSVSSSTILLFSLFWLRLLISGTKTMQIFSTKIKNLICLLINIFKKIFEVCLWLHDIPHLYLQISPPILERSQCRNLCSIKRTTLEKKLFYIQKIIFLDGLCSQIHLQR